MRPVMPHARAISSMTRITSRIGRPPPPYDAGTVIAMKPAVARSFTLSQGYSSVASQRAARSAKAASARSRARRRSACCSGVSSKSMATILDVDRLAERGQRRLERRLGQRRMRVDRVHQLLERRLQRATDGELVDHLGRLRTDDVRTEDLAGLLVGHDLDEALGLRHR